MNPLLACDPRNLLSVTQALIDFPSVSHEEAPLADALVEWITDFRSDARITRIGNSVIAQVGDSSQEPIVLAGHIDTVPPAQYEGSLNNSSRIVGDVLYGLGAADMKSGIAVMIALLADVTRTTTFIFYEAEEVADEYNGLRHIVESQPELAQGSWAVLLEPTNGGLEMGCQGALTVTAHFEGVAAHSARPWMGKNAIHKAQATIDAVVKASDTQPLLEIEELTYPSVISITKINGGTATNVIPASCDVSINHRYSPELTPDQALEYVEGLCEGADEVRLVSNAAGAMPAFDHPLVAQAREQERELVAKVAWTDVARFYALGIPAVNCGPGDATLCHRADEHIIISKLQDTYDFLRGCIEQ